MIYFDRVQELHSNKVLIPPGMRAMLGLHTGIHLHGKFDSAGSEFPREIVVSSIPHDEKRWIDVWRLRVTARRNSSSPDIIAPLLKGLEEDDIRIILARANLIDDGKIHHLDLLIDVSSLEVDDSMEDIMIIHLTIQEYLLDPDLHVVPFSDFKKHFNKIEEMLAKSGTSGHLERKKRQLARRSYVRGRVMEILGTQIQERGDIQMIPGYTLFKTYDSKGSPVAIEWDLDSKHVQIPHSVITTLKRQYSEMYDCVENARPLVALSANVEDHLLSLLFFFENMGVEHVIVICPSPEECEHHQVYDSMQGNGFLIHQFYYRPGKEKSMRYDFLIQDQTFQPGCDGSKNRLELCRRIKSIADAHSWIMKVRNPLIIP